MESAIDRIRARREELRTAKTIDLLVPGYEGWLAVRYAPIEDDEFDKLAAKFRQADASQVDSAIDLLLKAAEVVLIREGDEMVPLLDSEDRPIGLDLRLAETLQYEADTARAVVRGLFSPDGAHPLAPNAHGGALLDWLAGNEAAIDQVLLGE